jgi:hypothetical protein
VFLVVSVLARSVPTARAVTVEIDSNRQTGSERRARASLFFDATMLNERDQKHYAGATRK